MAECTKCTYAYSLHVSAWVGCETCGPEVEVEISRECIRCRRPITRETHDWNLPAEFTSPEFDAWFAQQEAETRD